MKPDIIIRKIVFGALFTSIAIVIKLFITFDTPIFRLSFYEVPLIMCSILLGPLYGALSGFITDINYIIINPHAQNVGLNWFTVESVTFGFLPGFLFYLLKFNKRNLSIILLITMILGFTFNTLGIQFYFGTGTALSSIPFRFLRDAVKYPLYIYLLYLFLTDKRFASFIFFKKFHQKNNINHEFMIE